MTIKLLVLGGLTAASLLLSGCGPTMPSGVLTGGAGGGAGTSGELSVGEDELLPVLDDDVPAQVQLGKLTVGEIKVRENFGNSLCFTVNVEYRGRAAEGAGAITLPVGTYRAQLFVEGTLVGSVREVIDEPWVAEPLPVGESDSYGFSDEAFRLMCSEEESSDFPYVAGPYTTNIVYSRI